MALLHLCINNKTAELGEFGEFYWQYFKILEQIAINLVGCGKYFLVSGLTRQIIGLSNKSAIILPWLMIYKVLEYIAMTACGGIFLAIASHLPLS